MTEKPRQRASARSTTPVIETNHDFHRYVASLVSSKEDIPLRRYLQNLRRQMQAWRHHDAVPVAVFVTLLARSFETEGKENNAIENESTRSEFEESEPSEEMARPTVPGGSSYARWVACIDAQLLVLQEMEEAGLTEHERRYLGLHAPSGAYWCNFSPALYLGCATVGAFGGWVGEESAEGQDESGRQHVAGKVAVFDVWGDVTVVDPQDIEEPIVPMTDLSWDDLVDFLEWGQWYE